MSESNIVKAEPITLETLQALSPISKESAPPTAQFNSIPYVGLFGPKAVKHRSACEAAGIVQGDFFLMDVQPIAIKPFEVSILHVFRAYVLKPEGDDTGKVIGASFVYDTGRYEEGYNETLHGVVAVCQKVEGRPVYTAATIQLQNALCKAFKDGLTLLGGRAAKAETWAPCSANHAATKHAKLPGGRFRIAIRSTNEKPVGGGQAYNLGHGQIVMPQASDVDAFNKWLEADMDRVSAAIQKNLKLQEKLQSIAAENST